MASNHGENLKQAIRNWCTALLQALQVLETSGDVTNIHELAAREAERLYGVLWAQVLQIREENGLTEELKEELQIYYGRILNWPNSLEYLRDIIREAIEHPHTLLWNHARAEVEENLEEFLRKFLEIENSLNDQHNEVGGSGYKYDIQ